jgi:hypothetical protein
LLLQAQCGMLESDLRDPTRRGRFLPSEGVAARLLKPVQELAQRQ